MVDVRLYHGQKRVYKFNTSLGILVSYNYLELITFQVTFAFISSFSSSVFSANKV